MNQGKKTVALLVIILLTILLIGCKAAEQTILVDLFAERTLSLQKARTDVQWQSSDQSVVSVDQNGRIAALKPGKADVSATVQGKAVEIFHLIVEVVPVTDIQIDPSEISLELDESIILTYTLSPTNASDYEIEWSSSDMKVATVDKEGKVSVNRPGTALISCTAPSGVSKSCEITVTEIMAKEITPELTELSIEEAEQQTIGYTVAPESAAAHGATWTSSDESVATVSEDGTITALKPGQCVVAVQVDAQVAQIEVTVTEMTAKSITPDMTELTLDIESQATVNISVLPETTAAHEAIWTSSDESVATVSSDGTILALDTGRCTVTVQVDDQTAQIQVEVTKLNAREREIVGKWTGTTAKANGKVSLATEVTLWLYEDKTGVLKVGDDQYAIVSWNFVLDSTSDNGQLISGYRIFSKDLGTWTAGLMGTTFGVSFTDDTDVLLIFFKR